MQIKYHLEGSERKALLAIMREILQDTPKYMGPPIMQRNSICEEYR